MKKQRITARVADLVLNEGQIEWLPKNPRQWTQEDIDRTKASLLRDADFQEDRPLLVLKHDDKLLVFAGNLRTTSAKELKWDSLEAVLYTPESDEDCVTIKRRAMLDNGSFGDWDFDALANEWDDLPLVDWGIPAWKVGSVDMDAVDALFEDSNKPKKEEELTLTITIPKLYEDNIEDIESAVKVTLEEWIGCTVK
jgi:hypothetical protein